MVLIYLSLLFCTCTLYSLQDLIQEFEKRVTVQKERHCCAPQITEFVDHITRNRAWVDLNSGLEERAMINRASKNLCKQHQGNLNDTKVCDEGCTQKINFLKNRIMIYRASIAENLYDFERTSLDTLFTVLCAPCAFDAVRKYTYDRQANIEEAVIRVANARAPLEKIIAGGLDSDKLQAYDRDHDRKVSAIFENYMRNPAMAFCVAWFNDCRSGAQAYSAEKTKFHRTFKCNFPAVEAETIS